MIGFDGMPHTYTGMSTPQPRKPAGVPTGGQFASHTRPAPGYELGGEETVETMRSGSRLARVRYTGARVVLDPSDDLWQAGDLPSVSNLDRSIWSGDCKADERQIVERRLGITAQPDEDDFDTWQRIEETIEAERVERIGSYMAVCLEVAEELGVELHVAKTGSPEADKVWAAVDDPDRSREASTTPP